MLVLAWSIAAAALARGPEVDGIRAYDLPGYTIVTLDPTAAQAAARASVKADAILGRLLGGANTARNAPTILALFPNAIWARYLAPGRDITGQFVPHPFVNYVEVGVGTEAIEQDVMHEYTHCYLHSQTSGLVPLWFDEGLAQFVANATITGEIVTLGKMPRWLTYVPNLAEPWTKVATSWMPMVTLLGLDGYSRIYRDTERNSSVHKQAWVLVHRGLATDPDDFGRKMSALLDAQKDLVPAETAIRNSFGMSPANFDLLVRSFLKAEFATRELEIGPLPFPGLPAGRELPALESLDLLAGMMMASEYHLDRFDEVIEAMDRAAPGSPVTRAWRMRLAARRGGGALAQLVHGLRAGSDPRLLRGAGLALFERALAAQADARPDQALVLLGLATSAHPDDAEAVWAYATLAAGLKRDLPLARIRITSS